MLAVDTNALVRLVACDDPNQARQAFRLFECERLWIGKTVLLETEKAVDSVRVRSPNRSA